MLTYLIIYTMLSIQPNTSEVLAEYTQNSFIQILKDNKWLNEFSKRKAIEKVVINLNS